MTASFDPICNVPGIEPATVLPLELAALNIDVATKWSEVSVTRGEWNDLCARCADANVFQTFEWYASWWAAFGRHHQLLLLTARNYNRLLGIAPLMIVGAKTRRARITFIGAEHADYQDFLLADDASEVVLDRLLARLLELDFSWRRFELRNVPETSINLKRLMVIAGSNGLLSICRKSCCPTLRIRGNEAHVKRIVDKYSMRRPFIAFKRLGDIRWRTLTNVDEALEYLPKFAAQHADRWRDTNNPSQMQHPDYEVFYQALIRNMIPCGTLDFSVVELNGEPVAFHLGFLYRGRRLWYKPSFSIAHAKWSPGTLLIRFLIENALNSGVDELDFTIGNEPFKQRYANMVRTNVDVTFFKQRIAYNAEKLHRGLRSKVRRFLNITFG